MVMQLNKVKKKPPGTARLMLSGSVLLGSQPIIGLMLVATIILWGLFILNMYDPGSEYNSDMKASGIVTFITGAAIYSSWRTWHRLKHDLTRRQNIRLERRRIEQFGERDASQLELSEVELDRLTLLDEAMHQSRK